MSPRLDRRFARARSRRLITSGAEKEESDDDMGLGLFD